MTMKKRRMGPAWAGIVLLSASSLAWASSIAQVGAGKSVTHQDAFAGFESRDALQGEYTEDGLLFYNSYSGVNNGCGYSGADCPENDFSGNFMYYRGYDSNFVLKSTGGNLFKAVEFIWRPFLDYSRTSYNKLEWTTFRSGHYIGSSYNILDVPGSNKTSHIVGVSDPNGFDQLNISTFTRGNRAPGFDNVRVQYTLGSPGLTPRDVPAPQSTMMLFLLGLGLIGVGLFSKIRLPA